MGDRRTATGRWADWEVCQRPPCPARPRTGRCPSTWLPASGQPCRRGSLKRARRRARWCQWTRRCRPSASPRAPRGGPRRCA
eukprot:4350293-Alexandrium_andersonii.AAC.1